MKKKKSGFSTLNNLRYVFTLLCKKHKSYVFLNLLYAILRCFEVILPVLYTKKIVDLLTTRESIPSFVIWSAFFFSAMLLESLMHKWMDCYFNHIASQKVRNTIRIQILQRAKRTEYVRFDDPSFFDLYSRSISEGEDRCLGAFNSFCGFITTVLSLSGITAIIFQLSWPLVVLSAILVLAHLWVVTKANRLDYNRNTAALPIRRANDYIKRLFYQKQFAKEIKVYSLDGLFIKRQEKVSNDLVNNVRKFAAKDIALGGLGSIVNLTERIGIGLFCGISVLLGKLTLSGFVALQSATDEFIYQLVTLFGIVPEIKNSSFYISDFRRFMESDEEKPAENLTVPDRFTSLTLDHAGFTYEGSGFSLKDLSITIQKGEKIAIVGENGSGKSTLIKMLMNLYHPANGKICYNGKSYDEYDAESLHSSFGAVFQDVQSYDMTIAEFILLREYTEDDYPIVWEALKKCGLYDFVQKLPKGLETHISTEFDSEGMELSGGQLQKLAIARIYAGNYDFIILDEPTSALDPRSEYEFNKTLFDIAKDKTVIFISHRLSTTRFADKIYLMDGGRIVEQGSHDELMQIENGHYRELFDMQAEYYLENEGHKVV